MVDSLNISVSLYFQTDSDLGVLTNKFKHLYEKAYPGGRKLAEQFPDMTLAEQRMAALCKLKLSNQEMATMLGISNDSVRKSKQRLRARVGLPMELSLEEYLSVL